MSEIEKALRETEPFQWSHERAALIVEADADDPDTITIVAGVPDGDWDYLLEKWLTAALWALPSAAIEDAEIVDVDLGDEAPNQAARIRLSVTEDLLWGGADPDTSP